MATNITDFMDMPESGFKYVFFCGHIKDKAKNISGYSDNDECFIDGLNCIPPLLLTLVILPTLLVLRSHREPKYWVRFPWHIPRWLFFLGIYVINIAEIGEGILSDQLYVGHHPHLYVTPFICFIGNIVANIYYHKLEIWNLPKFLIVLDFYWVACLIVKCFKWWFTMQEGLNVYYMRFDLAFDNVAAYSAMIVTEIVVFIKLRYVCCKHRVVLQAADELKVTSYVYNYACFPSKTLYHWINSFLWKGYKHPFEVDDLDPLPKTESCEQNLKRLSDTYESLKNVNFRPNEGPSLLKSYTKTFWPMIALAGFYKLMGDMLLFGGPICLIGIVKYVEKTQEESLFIVNNTLPTEKQYLNYTEFYSNGYVLCFIVLTMAIFTHTFLQSHHHVAIREGARLRIALQSMIYDKSLKLSTWSLTSGEMTQGQMVNYIAVDSYNLMYLFYFFNYCWAVPIQVTIAMIFLYIELGYSGLMGLVVMIVLTPIQGVVTKCLAKLQKQMLECSDDRLKRVNELFQGIKLIKLYAWEDIFCGAIRIIRDKHMRLLFRGSCIQAFTTFIAQGTPVIVTLMSFGMYTVLEDEPLTAGQAFASLSLFNMLSTPLQMAPFLIPTFVNAKLSTGRLEKFLRSPEVQKSGNKSTVDMGTNDMLFQNKLEKEDKCKANIKPFIEVNNENQYASNNLEIGSECKESLMKQSTEHSSVDNIELSASSDKNGTLQINNDLDPQYVVQIKDGGFSWDVENQELYFENLNFTAEKGCLTVLVGSVGSGKSSLLSALLGEMYRVSGTIIWKSGCSVSYASQKPWLLNTSLQENILFGSALDNDRYKTVLEACALYPDISVLPAGELTEIGEKGINLSGGQKARVSLARALYSYTDVLILDDPFSALDVHVGKHVFENGILKILLESKRTVILVTHQLEYVKHANMIYRLHESKVTHQGTLPEIKENAPELFKQWQKLMKQSRLESQMSTSEERVLLKRSLSTRERIRKAEVDFANDTGKSISLMSLTSEVSCLSTGSIPSLVASVVLEDTFQNTQVSTNDESSALTAEKRNKVNQVSSPNQGQLIEEEDRMTGSVTMNIYWGYIQACSVILPILVLIVYVSRSVSEICMNFWLARWSSEGSRVEGLLEANATSIVNGSLFLDDNIIGPVLTKQTSYYVRGYAYLSFLTLLLGFVGSFTFYLAGVRASIRLHADMLRNIVHAPMRFFDTTPVGRILNRFSGDIATVDNKLVATMQHFVNSFRLCLIALIVNAIAMPYYLLFAVPTLVFYFCLQRFFQASSRELQRLESITKSPILAHFSETVAGLATIRAFRRESQFSNKMQHYIDENNKAFMWLNTANRWLGIRLDHLGGVLVFGASLCSLIAGVHGYISPGIVGLAIAYALQMCNYMNWVVRTLTDTEMQMSSVERIKHYTNVEREKSVIQDVTTNVDLSHWPSKGEITFSNVSLRYASDLDAVVSNFSLHVSAGSKVGICGRTGSGKSSLTLGLLRMIDLFQGDVHVDGINTKHIPVEVLRGNIAIVPQDPVLFIGSIRFNLDPTGSRSDSEIWEALEISQLKSMVSNLSKKLDENVSEGGENFSAGQKQLMCLARAFLKKSPIVIMDEATSSIDQETDATIQKVMQEAFTGKTLLIIAHRVSTIVNCDQIVVLSEGKLVENGSPKNLLKNKESIFSSFVKGSDK